MKSLLMTIIFFLSVTSVFSQNKDKNIYSGGMLILQPGYIITSNIHQNIQDLSFGLGGILRFYFCDYFTAGIYGGSQRTKYHSTNSRNSYFTIGYGGPFVGLSRKAGKLRYTISAFVGKGTIKNLHIENQNNNVLKDAYLYRYSVIVLSPILSLDIALSQRLHLTIQAVCLTTKFSDDRKLYNPTVQTGILFNR